MKRRITWMIMSILMALALVLTSCGEKEVEEEEEEGVVEEEEEEGVVEEEEEEGPPVTGNWWDKFGEPEYGGTLSWRVASLPGGFNNNSFGGMDLAFWLEPLWTKPNNIIDRNDWAFITEFTPEEYEAPILAESWEQPDMKTVIVHLREGINFQDKPPVNGREFTANDVEHHYDRMLGTGSGYTEGIPMYRGMVTSWDKVRAIDKYTVEFKFKIPSAFNLLAIMDPFSLNLIEAPESVQQGLLDEWQDAVGTGPYLIKDFVAGSTQIYTRNPNYWGYDERYPQNRLPYADTLKAVCIPDSSTAMAALRTGKIDLLPSITWQQAQTLDKTNPELKKQALPGGSHSVAFRNDHEPFTDINVRKAMQLAIDRETIAKTYYGDIVDGIPSGMISKTLKGYCFAYEDWPQSLKDEYSYNPERARQLLAEAGYPNGFETECVADTGRDLQLLQVMKSYFADIGVIMDITTMDSAAFGAFTEVGKHEQLSTQEGGFTWPPTRVISQYYSKGRDAIITGVNDPGYDAINDAFWASTTQAEAMEMCREADRYSIEHHWEVRSVEYVVYHYWQPYLEGYAGDVHAGFWGQHYLWARMWVDQDKKASMGR